MYILIIKYHIYMFIGTLTLVMVTWHAGKQIKYLIFFKLFLFWLILLF